MGNRDGVSQGEDGLSVQMIDDGGVVHIFVRGVLDVGTAPIVLLAFRRAAELRPKTVAVDLADLSFIDVSGLSVLVRARARAADEEWTFAISSPSPCFMRLVELAGLTGLFDFDGPQSALRRARRRNSTSAP